MKISEFLEHYLEDCIEEKRNKESNACWTDDEYEIHKAYVFKLKDAIKWQKTYEQHAKDYGVKVYGEDVVSTS
tara:strand:- start:411 stop:629 length:219 start_codon:yes stop_codon:yes gene_type:complete